MFGGLLMLLHKNIHINTRCKFLFALICADIAAPECRRIIWGTARKQQRTIYLYGEGIRQRNAQKAESYYYTKRAVRVSGCVLCFGHNLIGTHVREELRWRVSDMVSFI